MTMGLLFALSPLLVLWFNNYQRENFSCESEDTFYKDDSSFTTISHFSFHGGKGSFDALGEYSSPGKPRQKKSHKNLTLNTGKKAIIWYWFQKKMTEAKST